MKKKKKTSFYEMDGETQNLRTALGETKRRVAVTAAAAAVCEASNVALQPQEASEGCCWLSLLQQGQSWRFVWVAAAAVYSEEKEAQACC